MKISWKIVFITIACLAVVSYIIAATVTFSGKSATEVCRGVQISVMDSTKANFITSNDINRILKNHAISMLGITMNQIHLSNIDKLLAKNPYVDNVECYKTLDGNVKINVWQRQPIAEVMGTTNYYIDNKLNKLPVLIGHSAFVPIISGAISDTFLSRDLFPFVQYIHQHEFWSAQIEQIYLQSDSVIELVPRLGDCVINLGTIDRYEQKMNKLMELYQYALTHVGWDRYSYIDLQYKDRVICTKKGTDNKPADPQDQSTHELQ
jgi:cell division protein FtsQ